MAYNAALAERVRAALRHEKGVTERRMFGGLAFLVYGHMCCGIVGDDLVLRLGEAGALNALGHPHARPMDFTGKPMKSMVFVGARGFESDESLSEWVSGAVKFARKLPPKTDPVDKTRRRRSLK